jgi:hypothetical protein
MEDGFGLLCRPRNISAIRTNGEVHSIRRLAMSVMGDCFGYALQ